MNIHSSLRMQECRHESENYNYQRIQLSNNKFINVILGGTLDLRWESGKKGTQFSSFMLWGRKILSL